MSHTNNISNLLNLKDPNIFFKDSCVSEERIKGITVKVFEGTLSYTPSECPKCGHKKADDLIHYGFKTTNFYQTFLYALKNVISLSLRTHCMMISRIYRPK